VQSRGTSTGRPAAPETVLRVAQHVLAQRAGNLEQKQGGRHRRSVALRGLTDRLTSTPVHCAVTGPGNPVTCRD
jgi:hypothetical protein